MNTSGMMSGVLVIGSMNSSLEVQPQAYYSAEPTPARNANKKSLPIRISVKKSAK